VISRLQTRQTATRMAIAVLFAALAWTSVATFDGGVASARTARLAKAAVKPEAGRYSGFVGPFTISFQVAAGGARITHLVTTFNGATFCSVPTAEHSVAFPALAVRDGRFTGSTSLNPPSHIIDYFSISGKFTTATRASGTVHEHFTVTSLPPCSASDAFSVTRVRK
jgi:hypothetical protein